jgi:ferritin-like metal-binding protein YciE
LGEGAKSKLCKAMKGLIEEANEHISEHERGSVLDSVLIIGSQKIEHYEIAGYWSVPAIAKSLGNGEVLGLLQATLAEEEQTDKRLTSVALRIQKEMMSAKPEPDEEEESARRSSRGRSRK